MKTSKHEFSFHKLFWVFFIGSFIGAIYEETLHMIKQLLHFGILTWEPRRGVFWGPISPIYGMGAVALCLLLVNQKDSTLKTFIKASLLGGFIEYSVNFLQEMFLRTSSWNYADKFLNIHGRTTIPFMIFWGLLGICFVKFVYPWLSRWVDSITRLFGKTFTTILIVLLAFDLLISWTALIRQALRHYNVPAISPVGKFYDEQFDDDYIARKFPNMIGKE